MTAEEIAAQVMGYVDSKVGPLYERLGQLETVIQSMEYREWVLTEARRLEIRPGELVVKHETDND